MHVSLGKQRSYLFKVMEVTLHSLTLTPSGFSLSCKKITSIYQILKLFYTLVSLYLDSLPQVFITCLLSHNTNHFIISLSNTYGVKLTTQTHTRVRSSAYSDVECYSCKSFVAFFFFFAVAARILAWRATKLKCYQRNTDLHYIAETSMVTCIRIRFLTPSWIL